MSCIYISHLKFLEFQNLYSLPKYYWHIIMYMYISGNMLFADIAADKVLDVHLYNLMIMQAE